MCLRCAGMTPSVFVCTKKHIICNECCRPELWPNEETRCPVCKHPIVESKLNPKILDRHSEMLQNDDIQPQTLFCCRLHFKRFVRFIRKIPKRMGSPNVSGFVQSENRRPTQDSPIDRRLSANNYDVNEAVGPLQNGRNDVDCGYSSDEDTEFHEFLQRMRFISREQLCCRRNALIPSDDSSVERIQRHCLFSINKLHDLKSN